MTKSTAVVLDAKNYIPKVRPEYVKTENFEYIKKVYSKTRFRPILATGETGTGKSLTVEQVCAELGRPMFKQNINQETSKHELIGHMTLKDGNTIFEDGVIVKAMKMGAVVILDEFDAGNANKMLCLQSIMEGNSVHVPETGETVYPKEGFQVFLTANTKGLGDETGRYVGTGHMNEAFLERIAVVLNFKYMNEEQERDALKKHAEVNKIDLSAYDKDSPEKDVISRIAEFAHKFRTQQEAGSLSVGEDEHTISSRRLKMLVDELEYSDGSVIRAMKLIFSRFSDSFANAAIDFYVALFNDDSLTEEEQDVSDPFNFFNNLMKKQEAERAKTS